MFQRIGRPARLPVRCFECWLLRTASRTTAFRALAFGDPTGRTGRERNRPASTVRVQTRPRLPTARSPGDRPDCCPAFELVQGSPPSLHRTQPSVAGRRLQSGTTRRRRSLTGIAAHPICVAHCDRTSSATLTELKPQTAASPANGSRFCLAGSPRCRPHRTHPAAGTQADVAAISETDSLQSSRGLRVAVRGL